MSTLILQSLLFPKGTTLEHHVGSNHGINLPSELKGKQRVSSSYVVLGWRIISHDNDVM